MKILYDGDLYNWQKAGGINRYFEQIISHLPEDFEPHLLSFHQHPQNWPAHSHLKFHRAPLFAPQKVARRLGRHYFQHLGARLKPDLVHPTFYYTLSMKPLDAFGCPSVVTVYDFIMDIFSQQWLHAREQVAQQFKTIQQADMLLCISQNTRVDLLNRFPHLENRTHVTPLAGDLSLAMAYGNEPTPEKPYFLFVGGRISYKNFDGALRAFAPVAKSVKDLLLAVVGPEQTSEEAKLIHDLGLQDNVVFYGRLPDSHLAKMYRCSLALIYPSFYEGFGIPPLEAMNCQTLAVVSNTSSLPEVVGDAAFLFDPQNDDALSEILLAIARGEVDRAQWLERGEKQANRFSWARTAKQTATLYRSLLA